MSLKSASENMTFKKIYLGLALLRWRGCLLRLQDLEFWFYFVKTFIDWDLHYLQHRFPAFFMRASNRLISWTSYYRWNSFTLLILVYFVKGSIFYVLLRLTWKRGFCWPFLQIWASTYRQMQEGAGFWNTFLSGLWGLPRCRTFGWSAPGIPLQKFGKDVH